MSVSQSLRCSVSEFVTLVNQTLEFAYPTIEVEGEVSSFKVNQGKFVFFDLKDDTSTVNCFMMVYQLRIPIEDGMRVVVTAQPKLTKWGRFSLTVRQVRPVGEGSLKKSFEILKAKLEKEGLFAEERKRALPDTPSHIAVISSTQAAGYADFCKILDDRWGDVRVDVAHVQVQGESAPDQMIRALKYFNQQEDLPEVIVMIRGGGSADDLSAFNDELLVREVAASRAPVLSGIGHEVDTSFVDLVADKVAATPSNAAQLLVPDRRDTLTHMRSRVTHLVPQMVHSIDSLRENTRSRLVRSIDVMYDSLENSQQVLSYKRTILEQINPELVLKRGYAIMRGEVKAGNVVTLETRKSYIKAEVKYVENK